MKNKKIIVIIVLSVLLFLTIDFLVLIYTGNGPYISIKEEINNGKSKIYKSFFYNVWKCDVKNNPKIYIIKPFYKDYNCDVLNGKKFVIIDENESCKPELDEIGRDDMYIYYFSCKDSNKVYLLFNDNKKIAIKKSISLNYATIDEIYNELKEEIFVEVINK